MGKAPRQSYDWFRQARYGMFIHYGLYSQPGRHEWVMCYERIPFEEYRTLIDSFNPKEGCVKAWVRLAREVGMRYMCLTTRHHEGFALFETAASDFNSVKSPCGRDLIREYVEACNELDIGVGLYYSVGNWGDPGYIAGPKKNPQGWKRFVEVAHTQLRELMSNYGKIRYLFYDACPPPEFWDAEAINAEIRKLQPETLISDRCSLDEDVKSAEGHTVGDPGKPWESCMTSNSSWGYNYGDHGWMTARRAVLTLLRCCHEGGNLLLNMGPKGDGSIPKPYEELVRGVGAWLERNGDAVYGTKPHPFDYADQRLSTSKGNTVYMPFPYYHGPQTVVAGVGNKVLSARMLATGEGLEYSQEGNRVFLTGLPEEPFDPVFPVVALELDGEPKGVPNPLLGSARYT